MTTPDPLLERLSRLPRARLDDVASARTLGRAEAAYASAHAAGAGRSRVAQRSLPLALALWGAVYAFGAARELGRLFGSGARAAPAVASCHRGASDCDAGVQFMLNAINKTSARTTTTMTIAPPFPDTLWAISRSTAVPVWSDLSSDMESSMHADRYLRYPNTTRSYVVRGGPRHDRGAEGGAVGVRAAAVARASTDGTGVATKRSVSACGGSFPNGGRACAARTTRS
jgi:hypothetical protein